MPDIFNKLRDLRQERAAVIDKAKAIAARWDEPGATPTDDELRDHDAACDTADRLRRAIESEERRRDAERSLAEIEGESDGRRSGRDDEERQIQRAVGQFSKTGECADILSESRSLMAGVNDEGGYITVPFRVFSIRKRIKDMSPMRRLCASVEIGERTKYEQPLQRGETGAEWITEPAARQETTAPRLGLLQIPLNELHAQTAVSQMLLDLTEINVGEWVIGEIADAFAKAEGAAFVSGDGHLKPKGFLSFDKATESDSTRAADALQYVPSGAAAAITADGLRDLYWAMRAPHRSRATWLMSSATANQIDKLKDGNGDYLWRDGLAEGSRPTLLGRPVEFSEDMPSITGDAFPVAFGDWEQGYLIVDSDGVRVLRDPFSSKPFVLFDGYRRVGGYVTNEDAIKVLKIATS